MLIRLLMLVICLVKCSLVWLEKFCVVFCSSVVGCVCRLL